MDSKILHRTTVRLFTGLFLTSILVFSFFPFIFLFHFWFRVVNKLGFRQLLSARKNRYRVESYFTGELRYAFIHFNVIPVQPIFICSAKIP